MPTTDITVEKRSDDYRAWLSDSPRVWESGKSEAEALGKLVISAGTYSPFTLTGSRQRE